MKKRIQHIHFTGIGGIGMSGIAELLHNQGFQVQGSDAADSPNVQHLRLLGIPVFIGHDATHLGQAQVVVVSSAIHKQNPEILAAYQQEIPVIPRAEMLAELMRMKQGIAVAGSHGKTTITSMIAHGMECAGLDPTYVIGGRLMASGSNVRLGESPWLVAEADESDGSFLRLSPTMTVVSNIDPEHLDHYGDFDHLMGAFEQFVQRTPFYGLVVLHHEHPNVAKLRENLHKRVTTYGQSPQADLSLSEQTVQGHTQFLTIHRRKQNDDLAIELPMPGLHNAENCMAATAVLLDLGITEDVIQMAFRSFSGIQRRFQCTPYLDGVLVDDYAHHPKEILATLEAARHCWQDKKRLVIFQPHRYTRTRDLMEEFLGAFDACHEVLILPIYAASESPIEGISSEKLSHDLMVRGHRNARFCNNLSQARHDAIHALQQGDIVLLLGAGSIGGLARELRQELSKSTPVNT
ncbi:MAG: UDP-N-acetylmuramate--L-alanine ligase [Zetaproteobacteria bacterium]|nr:UDP-N-acetylmuramate--L-alanine ligase [Zetaproteobacteria bacterium]